MITLVILFFVIGACKGTCDSIEFHDYYSARKRFWQQDSWRDKKNIFGFVWNAWHTFDIIRNVLAMLAVALVIYFQVQFSWWLICIPIAFQAGFEFFYKSK